MKKKYIIAYTSCFFDHNAAFALNTIIRYIKKKKKKMKEQKNTEKLLFSYMSNYFIKQAMHRARVIIYSGCVC